MQNFRRADGTLGKLARQCVDTGMGLERVVSVLQGQESNYGIDTFRTLIAAVDSQLSARSLPVAPSAADAASRTVRSRQPYPCPQTLAEAAFGGWGSPGV